MDFIREKVSENQRISRDLLEWMEDSSEQGRRMARELEGGKKQRDEVGAALSRLEL